MKIGDTLYRFDGNSRIYRSGKIVYRGRLALEKSGGER